MLSEHTWSQAGQTGKGGTVERQSMQLSFIPAGWGGGESASLESVLDRDRTEKQCKAGRAQNICYTV